MIISEDLFHKIINFINNHEDPSSRFHLDHQKYKDWGSFIRTLNDSIPDEVCPISFQLSLESGELKNIYKRCAICDHCKNNNSAYLGLIDLYLYYGYWFWQGIIDGHTFINLIKNITKIGEK